jgi:hypothetical protein
MAQRRFMGYPPASDAFLSARFGGRDQRGYVLFEPGPKIPSGILMNRTFAISGLDGKPSGIRHIPGPGVAVSASSPGAPG